MIILDCPCTLSNGDAHPNCTTCNGSGTKPPTTDQLHDMRRNALRTIAMHGTHIKAVDTDPKRV